MRTIELKETNLDAEQLELGGSAELWELIAQRRQQKTITREQLEQKVRERGKRRPAGAGRKPA